MKLFRRFLKEFSWKKALLDWRFYVVLFLGNLFRAVIGFPPHIENYLIDFLVNMPFITVELMIYHQFTREKKDAINE